MASKPTQHAGRPQPADDMPLWSISLKSTLLVGAVWPVLGGYFCATYTYLFQPEKTTNLTTAHCAEIDSPLITASWSLGVFTPQKYLFLFVIVTHLPPRLLWGILYQRFYLSSSSKNVKKWWYIFYCYWTNVATWMDFGGMVGLTIIDIQYSFRLHAALYVVWVFGFCAFMFNNAFLHHFSGWRRVSARSNRFFWLKVAMFFSGLIVVLSTAVSYPVYANTCSTAAFVTFSVSEYVVALWNGAFYMLAYWELPDVKFRCSADFSGFNARQREREMDELHMPLGVKNAKHDDTGKAWELMKGEQRHANGWPSDTKGDIEAELERLNDCSKMQSANGNGHSRHGH